MQITIILVIKNRPQKETENCLRSLANQNCLITLVDYGSTNENLEWERKICSELNIDLVEVIQATTAFNKSRALNIGIKTALTPYVMCGDIDLIYQPNFVEEVEKVLDSKRVIGCRRFDLDQNGKRSVETVASYGGCIILPLDWLIKVHGFDEFYTFWGAEDDDLTTRALADGFEIYTIPTEKTFCTHQWHTPAIRQTLRRNRQYFSLKKPIIRNNGGWGNI